ncbi:(Fe-S)-binding protein [Thermoflavifilum thermophilum]|uniref:Cysteine-rich domain-containing protein n=1 Tax=Thermoflavifilum thermophilum TaxID=1393122 RepID=A0A1I7NMT5_9BACT|nr:(Fe-S)-binding protein [Thermoflavifilum thermophilum]SFV35967.1 Cysteine-rich domain-containing protein [Thermoflavifilum thermophilum]
MQIPTVAELHAKGEKPELLYWVGCAASFDQRAQRTARALATIFTHAAIRFAILGQEESCTGDPARRAGNEFLFQMMALKNIQTLNQYGIQTIVTSCPHCFNTLKNEYPALGGHYEVWHHTQFIYNLIREKRIRLKPVTKEALQLVTYHDSCYLGRGNGIYDAPRDILQALQMKIVEMAHHRSRGMCCGAGGAQMWKEEEKGTTRVNIARTQEALATGSHTIAAACPFCNTMLYDGLKHAGKEEEVQVKDIAELVAEHLASDPPTSG